MATGFGGCAGGMNRGKKEDKKPGHYHLSLVWWRAKKKNR